MKISELIMETHPDSAISLLKHLKPEVYKSNSNRALYGLLLFQYMERINKKLPDSSLIDFSINYYLKKNDYHQLARCYYYKGHMLKYDQRNDEAAILYFKALDCLQNQNDLSLAGKIYADIGYIYAYQLDYNESLVKYRYSLQCFNKAGNKIEANYVILSIGRIYDLLKKYKTGKRYLDLVLKQNNDSILQGVALQETGIYFYWTKQYDSAKYYLRKSLQYPFKNNNYAIRCYILSDLFFDLDQFDSSFIYAKHALKYPANSFTQRECYRILTNIEYIRKDLKQMGTYMTHYQDCTNDVQKIRSQINIKVLENIYNSKQETKGTKMNLIVIVSVLIFILILSSGLVIYLYKRNKLKRNLLDVYKNQLNKKQEFVTQKLSLKIEEARNLQTDIRKNATASERTKLDIELYNNALYLNSWDDFNREMNHAFNNIIELLNAEYPTITRKEIIWCCLHLLDIPHPDRMLLLEASSDSLYKLKQRLAQKLNLKSTKELGEFLRARAEIKN